MVIEKGGLGRRVAAAIVSVIVFVAVMAIAGQEPTPSEKMSGAWQLDAAASSPLWSTTVADNAAEGRRKGSGGRGSQADAEQLPVGMRTAIDLMSELADVPHQMALTAKPESISIIDEHGVLRRFMTNNQVERVTAGTSRASYRTRWVEGRVVQDVTADLIDLSRTFETSADGQRLTITLTIRQQPDPRILETLGNRPSTRTYVFKHQ
jgi:hypothetical protein